MATLTEFLIALSQSDDLRARYNDDARRDDLLREFDLQGHPALQPGATIEEMQSAVAAEGPVAGAQPDWWILVNQDPIAIGDSWILAVEDDPDGPPVA